MATDVARHLTTEELEAGLDEIRRAPADEGTIELIVRRPAEGEREVLTEGVLDPAEGLVGDMWKRRGSKRTPDGSAHPDMQLTLMSARSPATSSTSTSTSRRRICRRGPGSRSDRP